MSGVFIAPRCGENTARLNSSLSILLSITLCKGEKNFVWGGIRGEQEGLMESQHKGTFRSFLHNFVAATEQGLLHQCVWVLKRKTTCNSACGLRLQIALLQKQRLQEHSACTIFRRRRSCFGRIGASSLDSQACLLTPLPICTLGFFVPPVPGNVIAKTQITSDFSTVERFPRERLAKSPLKIILRL